MKPRISRALVVVMSSAVGLLAGCSPLAPVPDRTEYYVLSPVSTGEALAAAPVSSGELSVGVGPIDFPGYLKRPEVVTRTAANQLDVSDRKRWGEPLDQNFARVLAQNLGELLGTGRVVRYPWYGSSRVDYQVEVEVQNFETSADGQSQLTATWTIRDPKDGRSLYTAKSSFSTSIEKGGAGPSAALSTDLFDLSRDIATQVKTLAGQRSKPVGGGERVTS